jgi:hypothetical protein
VGPESGAEIAVFSADFGREIEGKEKPAAMGIGAGFSGFRKMARETGLLGEIGG